MTGAERLNQVQVSLKSRRY